MMLTMALSAVETTTPMTQVIFNIIGALSSLGLLGAGVNIWLGRRRDRVDQGTLQVAKVTAADTAQGAFQDRVLRRLSEVEERLSANEERERRKDNLIRVLLDDIDLLENHIWRGLAPPPPKGKRHELST